MIKSNLIIKRTEGKWRRVFTTSRIPAKAWIEESPVVVMSKLDRDDLDKTLLHDYIFAWGKQKDACCMALGWIPLYNHAYQSNCAYFMYFEQDTIRVKSVQSIEAKQELTIIYNGDWNNPDRIWFMTE